MAYNRLRLQLQGTGYLLLVSVDTRIHSHIPTPPHTHFKSILKSEVFFMYVCMCAIYACIYVGVCAHVCACEGQWLTLSVFLYYSSSYLLYIFILCVSV